MYIGFLDCPIGPWVNTYAAWRTPEHSGALMRLLLASWQESPCATLPNEDSVLAAYSCLPIETFQRHKTTIMSGFILEGVRWKSPQLAQRAEVLINQHSESLSLMQASVVATTVAPDVFTLQMPQAESEQRARRRRLPEGFGVTVKLQHWAEDYFARAVKSQGGNGIPTSEEVKAVLLSILELFRADARSNSRLHDDWDAAFRIFVTRQTNGDFGLCSRYFPERFPMVVTPVATGVAPRAFVPRSAAQRRAEVSDSADSALAELIGGGGQPDDNVIDLDAPLMRGGR